MAHAFKSARHNALRTYLREQREAAGLRQVDLGKLLKRNQSYVSNLERGQKAIDVVELIDWANACGFDPLLIVKRLTRLR
jgi:transcriptional regulator with XRE-family HTH domain